jgi:hypothetical protein
MKTFTAQAFTLLYPVVKATIATFSSDMRMANGWIFLALLSLCFWYCYLYKWNYDIKKTLHKGVLLRRDRSKSTQKQYITNHYKPRNLSVNYNYETR